MKKRIFNPLLQRFKFRVTLRKPLIGVVLPSLSAADRALIKARFSRRAYRRGRVTHDPGLPKSREMKETRPLHPFPSFRVKYALC